MQNHTEEQNPRRRASFKTPRETSDHVGPLSGVLGGSTSPNYFSYSRRALALHFPVLKKTQVVGSPTCPRALQISFAVWPQHASARVAAAWSMSAPKVMPDTGKEVGAGYNVERKKRVVVRRRVRSGARARCTRRPQGRRCGTPRPALRPMQVPHAQHALYVLHVCRHRPRTRANSRGGRGGTITWLCFC